MKAVILNMPFSAFSAISAVKLGKAGRVAGVPSGGINWCCGKVEYLHEQKKE